MVSPRSLRCALYVQYMCMSVCEFMVVALLNLMVCDNTEITGYMPKFYGRMITC